MSQKLLPEYSCPARNRRTLLINRPKGIPLDTDFALDEVDIDPVQEGQFLVRNIYLSVDPAQRGWVNEDKNYSDPVPLNSVMRALAVGQVIDSKNPDIPKGRFVYGWFGWQDYCMATADQIMTIFDEPKAPLSAYAGILGLNGLTAYMALDMLGRPATGETVLVSTAAGSVGSIVGQLAKAKGCHVIGLTGSDDKVARCINSYGYDAAINYKKPDLAHSISTLAPDGIDIYYDNVGGNILDTAIRIMNVGGRIIQCGTTATADWTPTPQGLRNEREILTRRLIWCGFVLFDHATEYDQTASKLAAMIKKGDLHYDEHIISGIDHTCGAIDMLYSGANEGKLLIYIG